MNIYHTTPLISVIIPVFNSKNFIEKAVKSICDQTYKNLEILIIDDASTDGTWQKLEKLQKKDHRIKIFRNTYKKGLAPSLNILIPLTKGKYIARMDADDISHTNRLEKQLKFLKNRPNIVACGTQVEIIDEQGGHLAYKFFPTQPEECYKKIINYMVIQPPSLMARGDIMRKLRYDNSIFGNDDISIHFKLLSYGKMSNVDSILFKYRKRPNSLTHKNPKEVYFKAFKVRLKAISDEKYKPHPLNFFFALLESLLVFMLPNSVIITLFEIYRHKAVRSTLSFVSFFSRNQRQKQKLLPLS